MTKILELREPTAYDERFTVVFESGRKKKVYPSVVADLGLYPGFVLDEEALNQLEEAAGRANAKARAVRIASSTNISQKELRRRLTEKGESSENAAEAVQWLSDLSLLDDDRTARQLAQSAARKGYGAARIKQIFYQKGIPRELWDEVLADLPEPDGAIDRFLETRLRSKTLDQREIKRTVDALMRRGHSWQDIKSALRRYTDALEDQMEDFE